MKKLLSAFALITYVLGRRVVNVISLLHSICYGICSFHNAKRTIILQSFCASINSLFPSEEDAHSGNIYLQSQINILVNCSTGYICDGIPYTGKRADGKTIVELASKVVKQLVEPFYGSGRNITADNYFTDFGPVEELYQKWVTYVGTEKTNETFPKASAMLKAFPVGSCHFAFDQNVTVVSFIPKANKCVTLLSTMHNDAKVDDATGKPD